MLRKKKSRDTRIFRTGEAMGFTGVSREEVLLGSLDTEPGFWRVLTD